LLSDLALSFFKRIISFSHIRGSSSAEKFRRGAGMAQTPVMVNTICKWTIRQESQSSTNPLFRPLLTPMCAYFDS
jgi:hypothetical protein